MKRIVSIVILLLISMASFGYSAHVYQANKADIIIELSSFFHKLALPYHILRLATMEPDAELRMPVQGLRTSDIADTWNEARSNGRVHEGVDIFASRGTPVFSATEGYVIRVGYGELGGNFVFVLGKGGVRYYYAHLESVAQGIESGIRVTSDTVLGFVGSTGNAEGTPPHLHFGMYKNGPQNPYGMLIAR